MLKKIMFMLPLTVNYLYSTDPNNASDGNLLLNEYVSRILNEDGYDTNFSFCGDANIGFMNTSQKIASTDPKQDHSEFFYVGSIFAKYLAKSDTCGYGFETRIRQKNGLMKNGSPIFETAYVFLQTDKLGEVRLGFTSTAGSEFQINGYSNAVGFGGPGGGDLPTFYNADSAIISDGCGGIDDDKACKVILFSPTIQGYSFAASFTFCGKKTNPFSSKKYNQSYQNNVLSVAAKYEYGSKDSFNYTLSVGTWMGGAIPDKISKERKVKLENVKAYQFGAIFGYKDFTISLGYMDNGKSFLVKSSADSSDIDEYGANAGKAYSLGGAYAVNKKLNLSATIFKSTKNLDMDKKATANAYTVAAEYDFGILNKLGVRVYIEYNRIKTKSPDSANSGNLFAIGTKIAF